MVAVLYDDSIHSYVEKVIMSNRTVTYTIKLLSDIAKQASKDAQAIESTNAKMAKSYQKLGSDIDKAANHLKKLNPAAGSANSALDKMGSGMGARLARQLDIGIGKLKQMQSVAEKTGNVLGKIGKGAGMAVAGGVAAKYAAAAVLEKPVAYEARVARMAQTAYDGKDLNGFKATQAQIESAIKAANTSGGGRRDDAAAALDNMLAASSDLKLSISALPAVMKTATASGANPKELSDIVIKGVQNGYIQNTPEAISAAMDKAVAAGRAGQFELPDMAKWLGPQMAVGKKAGLGGDKGFDRLLMMNQLAMMSAGSKDEAGNNVSNLLDKLNSGDTARDFQKQTGGDLSKYLIAASKNGGDSVDAWVGLLRDEMSKNKDYQAAQKSLDNAKTPEQQRAASESVANIAMGTTVGKYFQDRQAMAALIPFMSDKTGVGAKVTDAIANSKGTVDFGQQTYATTTAFKMDQAANMQDAAVTDSFNTLKPAIDGVIGSFTKLGQAMPNGAAAVAGVGGVLTTVGAAAGSAMGAGMVFDQLQKRRGKSPTRQKATLPEILPTPNPPSRLAQAGGALKGGRVAGIAGVAAVVATPLLSAMTGENSAVTRYGGAAINGAMLGATIGSIVPVLGTAVGAAIGGAGGLLWEGISSHMAASKPPEPAYLNAPQTQAPIALQPQEVSFKMQDGVLKVQVQVSPTSELISATAQAPQSIPLTVVGGGNTNPAGYASSGRANF